MKNGQPEAPIQVGYARSAAAAWVQETASREKGFLGAYFSGSTVGKPDNAYMSPSSDIDVVVVTTQAAPPMKLGKFVYRGVLIEVTPLSWNDLQSPEHVLSSYHLAGSFRIDSIIADPGGQLGQLQRTVSQQFDRRVWVRRRCENVRQKIEQGLSSIDTSAPFHDQVTSWLFPTGVMTHILLVAALRNPTVRLRYAAVREVLQQYGLDDFYTELLELQGSAHLTPERVALHTDKLEETFDAAAAVARTPFFFSSDISAASRPIAIEGSRELIRSGLHREAVFWIIATFARCHKILAADAPQSLQQSLAPAFEAAVADLGIASTGDLLRRGEAARAFLPKLWETTEVLLSSNPDIID